MVTSTSSSFVVSSSVLASSVLASLALASLALASSCASTPEAARHGITVVDDAGKVVHKGAASWTVRATTSGREDVVDIKGLGEIIAFEARRCRLVRFGGDGIGSMTVWEATTSPRCVEAREDKICFLAPTTFVRDGASFTVDGCADRNDIFLSRVDGSVPASVGPKAFVERCAAIDSAHLNYVRVVDIAVEHNDRPRDGLRFRASGEDFEVCFLVKEQGHYRVTLSVEDPQPRDVVLDGEVDEL